MKSLYTEKEIDLLVDFFSNIDNFQKYNSDFLFEILWKRDSVPIFDLIQSPYEILNNYHKLSIARPNEFWKAGKTN